jgi:hypothetical protein
MKKILALAVLMTAGSAMSYATTCFTSGLFSADVALTTCTVDLTNVGAVVGANETLTYTSFVNTGTDAAFIDAGLDANNGTGESGFSWTDTHGAFPTGSTGLGFTVTITACAAGFNCKITGYADQVDIPAADSAAEVVQLTGLANENLSNANQTIDALNTINLQTVTKLGTYNGGGNEISYESDVFTSVTSAVPEPATFALMGAGLLGLGVLRRRSAARK